MLKGPKMKIKEIEQMDIEGLRQKLQEFRLELIKLNAEVATGTTPKSPGQLRQTKKNIAKLLTLINKKEHHKV